MTWSVDEEMLQRCRDHVKCGRVVVFDTETTGLSNDDEIVQIAAAEYIGGERRRTFALYVSPTCVIDPGAEEVHGLSREFLEANGVKPTEALERFFDFLGTDALLVGHNIRFDLRMLRNECRKFHCQVDIDAIPFCDTLALAKRVVPGLPCYGLGNLIATLGIEGVNSHDALDDTLACGELFMELVRRMPKFGKKTCPAIRRSSFTFDNPPL